MKKSIQTLLMAAAMLALPFTFTSCLGMVEAMLGDDDNPVSPLPGVVVKATELLADAQKEGATVVFWFYYEGNLYHVVFKKVGAEYIFQEGGADTQATTRTDWILDDSNTIKGLGGTVEYNDDNSSFSVAGALLVQIKSSTGEVKQKTSGSNTYLSAMGINISSNSRDKVKDLFKGNNQNNQPDNNDLDQVMLVTVDDNTGQQLLQTPGEIVANAAEQGIPAEKALGAAVENCQQKVAEDWEEGTSKIPEIKFLDPTPSVTFSSNPNENTYTQTLKTDIEGTAIYCISDDSENTCGAKINDDKAGKVTFEKPGKVKVEATFKDTDGFTYTTSYTLTVIDGSTTVNPGGGYVAGGEI